MHTEFCPCRSFHKQSLTAVTVGSGACLTSHTTCRSACCKHQPRNPYRGHPTSPRPELSAQQTQSPHVHSLFTHNLSVPRRSRAPRNSPRIAEAAYGARNVTAAHSSAARISPCPARRRRCANGGAPSAVPGPERHDGTQRPSRPPRDSPGHPAAGSWWGAAPPANFPRRGDAPGAPSARAATPHRAGRPARPPRGTHGGGPVVPGVAHGRVRARHVPAARCTAPHHVAPLRRGLGGGSARASRASGTARGERRGTPRARSRSAALPPGSPWKRRAARRGGGGGGGLKGARARARPVSRGRRRTNGRRRTAGAVVLRPGEGEARERGAGRRWLPPLRGGGPAPSAGSPRGGRRRAVAVRGQVRPAGRQAALRAQAEGPPGLGRAGLGSVRAAAAPGLGILGC